MNPDDRDDIVAALERVADLMTRWKVEPAHWCVLDGPAIKVHDPSFDSSMWRDHLNIYVLESALPWRTTAFELTVPPMGSSELQDLLELARDGVHVHLVPASRYYRAGFEHRSVPLPSGQLIEAATLLGCSQMWSYKSAELLEKRNFFEGDTSRIVEERTARLNAAIAVSRDERVSATLVLLRKGYEALSRRDLPNARSAFEQAAGPQWRDSE